MIANLSSPSFIIPSFTDQKSGYLNIESTAYPFKIDEKIWPSVEHYRLAKRFEGSILEEKIRQAKTTKIARSLTRPRSTIKDDEGSIKKEVNYGEEGIYIRSDWKRQDVANIELAVFEKFSQNPKIKRKLMETEGLKLVDESCEYHGEALEKARFCFIEGYDKKVKPLTMPSPQDDTSKKYITDEEVKLLKNFLKTIDKIKRLDSYPKEQQTNENVIYDALYNHIDKPRIKKIMSIANDWVQSFTWTDFVKKMPNFESLTQQVSSFLSKNHPPPLGVSPSKRLGVALQISSLLRWNRLDTILKFVKMDEIIIPPIKRSERTYAPLFIRIKKDSTTSSIERGAMYIKLFEKHEDIKGEKFSRLIKYFESMNPVTRDIEIDKFSQKSSKSQKKVLKKILDKEKV